MSSIADRHKIRVCPECGREAGKLKVTPVHFSLPGNRYDFPGAAMKWDKEHIKAAEKGKRKEEEQAKDLASSMY